MMTGLPQHGGSGGSFRICNLKVEVSALVTGLRWGVGEQEMPAMPPNLGEWSCPTVIWICPGGLYPSVQMQFCFALFFPSLLSGTGPSWCCLKLVLLVIHLQINPAGTLSSGHTPEQLDVQAVKQK